MKFRKLDDGTKDSILNTELQIYELTDCTKKDVRKMFRRQNSGKPLNDKQLRIVHESDAFSDVVYSLAIHSFMDKLMSNTLYKNGADQALIIQTLMLIETNWNTILPPWEQNTLNIFKGLCRKLYGLDICFRRRYGCFW